MYSMQDKVKEPTIHYRNLMKTVSRNLTNMEFQGWVFLIDGAYKPELCLTNTGNS